MGQVWSAFQSDTASCKDIDCGAAASGLCAEAAVAGIGTFAAFFVTATITLILSCVVIVVQWLDSAPPEYSRLDKEAKKWMKFDKKRRNAVREAVILSFSDQQLVTGLALAITTRYFYSCAMSAYHYDIICYLLLCSVVTHLCSLVAVDKYFFPFTHSARSTFLALGLMLLRLLGILATVLLTGLVLFNRNANTFPVMHPSTYNSSSKELLSPAVCFFNGADSVDALAKSIPTVVFGSQHRTWTHGLGNYVAFVIFTFCAIPIAILHSFDRGLFGRQPSSRLILLFRTSVVGASLAITGWMFYQAWELRAWIHDSGWLTVDGAGAAEDQWSFGQLLTVLIMVFAPIAMFQEAADKYDMNKLLDPHASGTDLGKAVSRGYGV